MENNMSIMFDAKSQNEGLARMVVSAFLTEIDPTVQEINDIKTAVSEAVTNAIVHGYGEQEGQVFMKCNLKIDEEKGESILQVEIKDKGVGIEDIEKAKEPLFTTKPELERSGMGFMFMEMFMDKIHIESQTNVGTTIYMTKILKNNKKNR